MNFQTFITEIKKWGEQTPFINTIILVGSYARGTEKPTSDIDLCILSTEKEKILNDPSIFNQFGKPSDFQIEYYGAMTSIRMWYQDGFELEYGIADMSWIASPLDSGTRQVLLDGYKVILDKTNAFEHIEI